MNHMTHEEHEVAIADRIQEHEVASAVLGEAETALEARTVARDASASAHAQAQHAFDDSPTVENEAALTSAKRTHESEDRKHARAVKVAKEAAAQVEKAQHALDRARGAHRELCFQDAVTEVDRNAQEFRDETLETMRTLKRRKALIAKARALGKGFVPDFETQLVNSIHRVAMSLEDHVRAICFVSTSTNIDDTLGDVE